MTFTSIWKPTSTASYEIAPQLPNTGPSPTTITSTTIHKLSPPHHPSYKYLNMTAATTQISDVLQLVCRKHEFPLALTWTPKIVGDEVSWETCPYFEEKPILSIQSCACYFATRKMKCIIGYGESGSKELQDIARKALQSNCYFVPSIGSNILNLSAAVVAMKIRISYTGDNDYIVQFFVPDKVGAHFKHPDELMKTLSSDMQEFCKSLSIVDDTEKQHASHVSATDFHPIVDSDIPSVVFPSSQTDQLSNNGLNQDVNETMFFNPVVGSNSLHQQVEELDSNLQTVEMRSHGGDCLGTCIQEVQIHDDNSDSDSGIGFDDVSKPLYDLLTKCAKAIHEDDLKRADQVLRKFQEEEEDTTYNYFAEALVRHLYNLYPLPATASPDLPYPTNDFSIDPFFDRPYATIRKSISASLTKTQKKSLHFIDLCFPDQLPGKHYWSRFLDRLRCVHGDLIIRISLVLLTGDADAAQQLTATESETESAARVVLLDHFIGSNIETDCDELVVVNSFFSLHRLLSASQQGQLEKVLRLVKDVIKPHFMILSEFDHTNLSPATPFFHRFAHSLRYHYVLDRAWGPTIVWELYMREHIKNMLFEPRQGFLTYSQWKHLLLSHGFAPLSLPPNLAKWVRKLNTSICRDEEMWMEENKEVVVLTCNNLPVSFTSIWKPTSTAYYEYEIAPQLPNTGPSPTTITSTIIHKLSPRHHPSYKYLNMTAATIQISDVLQLVCRKHEFPLALTWTPKIVGDEVSWETCPYFEEKPILSIQSCACYFATGEMKCIIGYGESGSKELQDIAREALQSNCYFVPSIGSNILNLSAAVVAMKIRISYTGDNDYIVQIFVPDKVGARFKPPDELMKTLSCDMQEFCKSLSIVDDREKQHASNVSAADLQTRVDSHIPSFVFPSQTNQLSNNGLNQDVNETMLFNPVVGSDSLHQQVEELDSNLQTVEMRSHGGGGDCLGTCIQEVQIYNNNSNSELRESGEILKVSTLPRGIESIPPKRKKGTSQVPKQNKKPKSITGDMLKIDMINSQASQSKQRKNRSPVWEHFERIKGPNGEAKAKCTYCAKELGAKSSKGTTPLWNHLDSCQQKRKNERDATVSGHAIERNSGFDLEKSRLDVARMIIKHQCPLEIAEHFHRILMTNLQPMPELPLHYTVKADMLRVYEDEKDKIRNWFGKLHCRFSLSITLLLDTKPSFCVLTSHFINEDWLLEKKIIGFKGVEYDNDIMAESVLFELVKNVLSEWAIDKNICSVTMSNTFVNDELPSKLNMWLTDQNLLLHRDLFHVYDFVHVINLMVQDILQEINSILFKIRTCIRYVNEMKENSQGIEMPFEDDPTRWNSTFLMLKSAVKLRERFCHLKDIENGLVVNLTQGEWKKAKINCKCLEVFYNLLCSFDGCKLTSNVFFPKASQTYISLLKWEKSRYTQDMAHRMKVKFDKYWRKCSLVLTVAVVLDPRFKFEFVEDLYSGIYGIDAKTKISEISTALAGILNEYTTEPRASYDSDVDGNSCFTSDFVCDDVVEAFSKGYRFELDVTSHKTELDVYLEEPTLDPKDANLDVLDWWHHNSSKYPSLGRMARDVLAIPMSVYESDSAFSICGKKIDPIIACKDTEIIEAWMCTKDWLQMSTIEQESSSFIHGSSSSSILPSVRQNASIMKSPIQIADSEDRTHPDHPGTFENVVQYSSKDGRDLTSVTISQSKCLEPGGQLNTPVMDFYIMYLRNRYWTHDASHKFFSTYFYSTLCEKLNETISVYLSFRKWWNKENIFSKMYIFIPIHIRDKPHWSLVVIYNPPKDKDFTSIIFHLDSLESSQFHESKLIFNTFERFLQHELDINGDTPRTIVSKKLKVPRQYNAHDCGIFVLYFMECFLKNHLIDLDDDGNLGKIFLSPDPSMLRYNVKHILTEMFEK